MENLEEIKEFEYLKFEDLDLLSGGTYYGNGVSCDGNGCSVDWSLTWKSIGDNLVASIGTGLAGVSNPLAYHG